MNVVYKYPIRIADTQEISMPQGAEIIRVDHDPHGFTCIWAIVNPDNKPQLKSIYIRGTGQPLPEDVKYFASFNEGPFVWHVFLPSLP